MQGLAARRAPALVSALLFGLASAPGFVLSAPAPGDGLLLAQAPALADSAARARSDRALEAYQRGRAYEESGRPTAALQAYQNAVRIDPSFPDVYFRLGLLFLGVGNVEEARQCFAEEVKRHPGHDDARRELGLVLARQSKPDEALELLEDYTGRHPESGLGWYSLGYAYAVAGRTDDAERALRTAIAIGPPNAVWHRDLGALLASRGRVDEARAEYLTALDLNPANPTPLINLGNIERREGDLAGALEFYRRAETIDSTLSIALHGQAQVLRELGRNDEAAAAYMRWMRRRPQEHGARLEAVRFLEGIGRAEEALAIARAGAEANPRSADAQVVLALALHSSGQPEEAIALMRRAESLVRTPPEKARLKQMTEAMERGERPDEAGAGGETP